MNMPDWLKPAIYAAGAGAAVLGIVGFTWGGWVTGQTAHERAMAMSHDDVVAAMVPVCLDIAARDPDQTAVLATLRTTATYQRRGTLMDAGWATMPGTTAPDRDIAQACLSMIDLDAAPAQRTIPADGG
ncbi:hypothetical protein [Roseicyclus marinus]|uniref:hypothetical protein n=1 Tax=Roseicyclus marinus TaxID=2161673 RepID=UPI00240FE246|nr:hypothetical protein [Roseicyclus marinus]MDG3041735.1 hypothetical protein [Roseicyclus marinus]